MEGSQPEPWSGYGHLDAYYGGALNLPESVLGAALGVDLLGDEPHAGASAANYAAELNRVGAAEALPPVIDFDGYQAAQQHYSGNPSGLDELLQSAQPNEPNQTRATRRNTQAQSMPRAVGMVHPSDRHHAHVSFACHLIQQQFCLVTPPHTCRQQADCHTFTHS